MLVRCNPTCRRSNGQTDCSLDVDNNNAVCNTCGDVLPNISDFAKLSMKSSGDVIRNTKRKAFTFLCNTCDKQVQTCTKAGRLVGKNCPSNQSNCQINVTETMLIAISEYGG